MTQESKDEEVYLAEGPFMRKDEDDETKLQETDKELRDMENSAGESKRPSSLFIMRLFIDRLAISRPHEFHSRKAVKRAERAF